MAENSHIEWTDHTFNPWIGCTKVSPGCANCYAETLMDTRYHKVKWGKGNPRQRTSAANWKQPLKWNRMMAGLTCSDCGAVYAPMVWDSFRKYEGAHCDQCGKAPLTARRARVFCASLADWLDDEVPIEWLADLLKLIHDTPNLDWLLLTKRPENWRDRIEQSLALWEDAPECAEEVSAFLDSWLDCIDMPERGDAPANVWIGTSVEDQKRADERIPELLKIPARVRFLSCEPLLGPVYFHGADEKGNWWNHLDGTYGKEDHGPYTPWPERIHWVICGGESGHGSRKFNLSWARSLRDQCASSGTAFFMKQFGSLPIDSDGQSIAEQYALSIKNKKGGDWSEWPADLRIRQFPGGLALPAHSQSES